MRKTFTVSYGSDASVYVEAETKLDAMNKVPGSYAAKGPRFTDSLRTKARKPKPQNMGANPNDRHLTGTPPEAMVGVHYLGTRAAMRALARL